MTITPEELRELNAILAADRIRSGRKMTAVEGRILRAKEAHDIPDDEAMSADDYEDLRRNNALERNG